MIQKKYLYGLDLAMENSGVVIFDLDTHQPVHIRTIVTNPKHTHGKRLYSAAKEFIELKDTYPPKIVTIERGFSHHNNATQVIFRMHGLANYLFHDVEQIYYPPKTVKEAIIKGDATKEFVRKTIQVAYSNVVFGSDDESDAFAVALTYMIKNDLLKWDKSQLVQGLVKKKKKSD